MKCEEVRELVQRDLDGDLNEMEQEDLKKHLLVCEECRRFHEKMMEVHLGLVSLPKVDPPYSLVERILPRLEELNHSTTGEDAKKGKKGFIINRSYIRYLSVAAVFALITFSFIQWMYGWNSNEKTEVGGEVRSAATSSQAPQASLPQSDALKDETATGNDKRNGQDSRKSQDVSPAQKQGPDGQMKSFAVKGDSEQKAVKKGEISPANDSVPPLSDKNRIAPKDPASAAVASPVQGNGESGSLNKEHGITGNPEREKELAVSPPPKEPAPADPVMGITAVPMEKVNAKIIPSPDKCKSALLTPTKIIFQDENGDTIYTLTANPGETFKNLTWIDENKVRYEVAKEDGSERSLELDLKKEQTAQVEQP